jgi:hypothetical protein
MNDFCRELARLRGKPYEPQPEPAMAMAATSYTDREIELLIDEAVNRRMKEIERAIAVPAPAPPAATLIEFAIRPLRDRIEALEECNDNFRRALGRYAISECGELPHPDLGITYLKCQIWYSPWLTQAEQRTKSIWSLRLSVNVRHHRLPEEINVRLFPIKQFYKTAKKPAMQTESVMGACEFLTEHASDNAYAGYVQGFTRKKGRPYVKEQAAFLVHADEDTSPMATQARLTLIIYGRLYRFSDMRPANGDQGSALWWCEWKPTSEANA